MLSWFWFCGWGAGAVLRKVLGSTVSSFKESKISRGKALETYARAIESDINTNTGTLTVMMITVMIIPYSLNCWTYDRSILLI